MAAGVDRFDTPPALARAMVDAVRKEPSIVADFAAGGGELLRAATKRWPKAKSCAIDIDPSVVRELRSKYPKWRVMRMDFLDPSERIRVVKVARPSLILLNPPFSCRGSKRVTVQHAGHEVTCSLAMAFLLTSIESLSEGGEIVAVLPAGTLTSDRDREALSFIRDRNELRVLSSHGRHTFDGCFVRTTLVHLEARGRTRGKLTDSPDVPRRANGLVEVIRGWLPVYRSHVLSNGRSAGFVHSTELVKGKLLDACRHVPITMGIMSGPAVLIPRVGEPNPDKIVILRSGRDCVLSDCVIALVCESQVEAGLLRKRLLRVWTKILPLYGGTCARYITVEKVCKVISDLGYHTSRGKARRPNLACQKLSAGASKATGSARRAG